MNTNVKKLFIFSLLIFTLSSNSVFAKSSIRDKKKADTKVETQANENLTYNYSSTTAIYPNQTAEQYYLQQKANADFVRTFFAISKMAEQNPNVTYKYTSTNVVYL